MPEEAVLAKAVQASDAVDDDRQLVEAFRRGDRRAFEVLVKRHQRPVWAIALRFAKDRDAAEDLAQRAFVQALERIGELKGAFRPWLMRIAVNLSKNHVRDHAKFARGEVPDRPVAPWFEESLDEERQRSRVRVALSDLTRRQREVVLLRIDADLAFAEVAQALGITENNAKVTFHQAVKKLKDRLGGEDAGV